MLRAYRFTRFLQAALCASFILLTSTTIAAAAEEPQLEEILVTATRREQPVQDVPAAVAVIDPQQYASGGESNLQSVLAYVPGVNFNDNGAPGQGSITMRGVSNMFSTPSVGIYIDDIPYGSVTAFANGADFALDALLGDVQRVEVIKGPQGTLFGASSMGGSVRYITREPSLTDFSGRVSSDLSDTRYGGLNQLYRANASIPLVSDKLALSVSGFYQNSEGFIDEVARGIKGINDAKLKGGQATLLYRPIDPLKIKVTYMRQKFDYSDVNAVQFDINTGAPVYGRYAESAPLDSPTNIDFELVGATIEYKMPWATATLVSSYQTFAQDALNDLTPAFGAYVDQQLGVPLGTNKVVLNFDIATRRIAEELRLTSNTGEKIEWIGGLYYTRESSSNLQDVTVIPGPFNLVNQVFPSSYKEAAAFGNVTYYITPKFDTTLGMRFSHNDMGVSFTGTGVLAGPDLPLSTVRDDVKTYLFNARYRPTTDLSLYTRIASGYRPASANLSLVNPNTGQIISPPFVKADTLWSYEVGAKGKALEDMLQYDVAVYYIKWKDLQVFTSFMGVNVGSNALSNVSASGVEASLTAHPVKGLTLTGSATYARSELDHDDPSIGARSGEQLPGIPKWAFAFNGNYEFPLSQRLTGFVGAGVTYKGENKTSFFGGTGAGATALTPSAPNFTIPHYSMVDVRTGVEFSRFEVSLYATNLFNQYGFQSATTAISPPTATVLRPRTVGAVLTATF